jgi:hypothetical protein
MLAVRRLTAGDIPAAVAIVRGLPDYFTDDVPGKVESDAAIHAGWVLADSGEVPPYVATRAFWELRGFVHVDTIDPLPGWQPGNPAAIYAAALRSTR